MTNDQHKKRLIGFDLDGTLATGNIWKSLNNLVGITAEEHIQMVKRYESHEISYAEWLKLLTERHRKSGITKESYDSIIKTQAQKNILPVARELISILLEKGDVVCIASGGIDLYVSAVANELGIKRWFANCRLEFDQNDFLREITFDGNYGSAKVEYLTKISEELCIPLSEIIFIGDSLNDLAAFMVTGNGIYIQHDEADLQLSNAAWKNVKSLLEVKPLLLNK